MVGMSPHVSILICVLQLSFSLPRGCNDLSFLCSGSRRCIFENSYAISRCDDICPNGICIYNTDQLEYEDRKRRAPGPAEVRQKEEGEEKVSDTYLHLHLNSKQKPVSSIELTDLARNITRYFHWSETAIKNCYEEKVHLTCVVVGLNPVIVSTKLALDNSIDRITPILVDSVGTSNKNASVLASEEEETTIVTEKMTLADVMIWVFGAVLLLLLVSLLLVYLVQKRQSNNSHKVLSNESDNDAEFYYESLVRNRIQGGGSTSSGGALHRPPNLTQHQVASKSWSSEDKTSPEYSLSQSMDIASAHLALTYMERYITDTDKIGQEWQRLCLYEAEMKQAEVGIRSENVAKNRFSTVVPYDHNRVKLSNQHASDYINASYIYSENPKQPTYIASQGPLQSCAGEFWQMVWEQGISEIIMLSINDAVDCYQYWGSDGSGVYYHYQLHLVSEHANQPDYPDYIVRSFYLKNLQTYETRTVTQFHYVAWPMGSSTPRSTQSLLDFRRKVHKGFRGASAPLLIHCNDGIGRTGTYILMDMTLRRICKGVKEVDMEAAVEHLRDQRPGMVVTKEQYAFALSAVVEEIHQILGEMPSPSPRGGTFIGAPLE